MKMVLRILGRIRLYFFCYTLHIFVHLKHAGRWLEKWRTKCVKILFNPSQVALTSAVPYFVGACGVVSLLLFRVYTKCIWLDKLRKVDLWACLRGVNIIHQNIRYSKLYFHFLLMRMLPYMCFGFYVQHYHIHNNFNVYCNWLLITYVNLWANERWENYFISLPPSSLFDYQASDFWNKCRKSNSEIDFTTSIKIVKTKLKICLLETQNRHDMFV